MRRSVSLFAFVIVTGTACSSSTSSPAPADTFDAGAPNAGDGGAEGSQGADGGNEQDARAEGDARTNGEAGEPPFDGGTDGADVDAGVLHGWTAETPIGAVLMQTSASAGGLVASPYQPRQLLIPLRSPGPTIVQVAVTWADGAWGPVLQHGADGSNLWEGGGGFASDGTIYDFLNFAGGRTPVSVGVMSAGTWSWQGVSPGGNDWPPRDVLVMPGAPTRAFVRTDGQLVEITAPGNPSFVTQGAGSVALSPDRTTFLAIPLPANDTSSLQRCTLASGACAAAGPLGLGAGQTPQTVWIDPLDGTRVFVVARTVAATYLYASKDGAASFAPVPLPPGTDRVVYSPSKPDTVIAHVAPTSSNPEGVQVTTQLGATWTSVPLPATDITDVSGLAFDAAGTLFLVRNDAIFSHAPF